MKSVYKVLQDKACKDTEKHAKKNRNILLKHKFRKNYKSMRKLYSVKSQD